MKVMRALVLKAANTLHTSTILRDCGVTGLKCVQHTAELFLEEDLEVVAASQVTQQLEKAEGPALYSHLGGDVDSGHKCSESHTETLQLIPDSGSTLARLGSGCTGSYCCGSG